MPSADPDPARAPRRNAMARQWFDDRFGADAIPELPADEILEREFGRQLDAADSVDPLRRGLEPVVSLLTFQPPKGWGLPDLPEEAGTVIQYENKGGGRVIATLNIKGHWNVLNIRPSHVVYHQDWEPDQLLEDLEVAGFYQTLPFRTGTPEVFR